VHAGKLLKHSGLSRRGVRFLGRVVTVIVFCGGMAAAESFDRAFNHLYSFRFAGAHASLDEVRQARRQDPMFHAARAAVYLFSEMDRLGILESEFYRDRGEKLKRMKLVPSPSIRESLHASLAETRELAEARLRLNAGDADAHFALALASGIECNYAVFVEKRRRQALPLAKDSHRNAMKTLAVDPGYLDAKLVTGINEYVMGSVPFFVPWFVRFEGIEGNRRRGVESLREVAKSGRYLNTLAKIVLATIHIREERWADAWRVTNELVIEYPENPLFRKELGKLREKAVVLAEAWENPGS
jgi:hypothetical protein